MATLATPIFKKKHDKKNKEIIQKWLIDHDYGLLNETDRSELLEQTGLDRTRLRMLINSHRYRHKKKSNIISSTVDATPTRVEPTTDTTLVRVDPISSNDTSDGTKYQKLFTGQHCVILGQYIFSRGINWKGERGFFINDPNWPSLILYSSKIIATDWIWDGDTHTLTIDSKIFVKNNLIIEDDQLLKL